MILNNQLKYRAQSTYTKTATTLLATSIFIIGVVANDENTAPTEKEPQATNTQTANKRVVEVTAIEKKLQEIILPSLNFRDTPLVDVLAFLQHKSVELDSNEPDQLRKGINLVIGPDVKRDTTINSKLTNVPIGEALRYITTLADAKFRIDPEAIVVIPGALQNADATKKIDSAKIVINQQKIDSIRIPSIEFKDIPITDALQFIQRKSVELDLQETERSKKGIKIIASGKQGVEPKETKLSLKLKNVTLASALKYICELTYSQYTVESHAIVVKPQNQ